MTRCPNEHENPPGAHFCGECGAPLEAGTQGAGATVPAGWNADPTGRHEYRYWDGTRWTDQVADGGAVTSEPVGERGGTGAEPAVAQARDVGVRTSEPWPRAIATTSSATRRAWYRRPWAMVLVALFAVVLLAGIAGAIAGTNTEQAPTVSDRSNRSSESTTTTIAPSTTTEPSSTTTTTEPPTTTTTSRRVAVAAWGAAHMDTIELIQQGLLEMQAAGEAGSTSGMRVACQDLHQANEQLHAALPTPDPELTLALQGAVDDFDTGAHFCITGIDEMDPAALQQAASYISQAGSHIEVATGILQRYNTGA